MRAAFKALNTVVAVLGLAVLLSASSIAGTITIVDTDNDIISFIDGTGGRLTTTNCPGPEALTCSFSIIPFDPTITLLIDHTAVSLFEPLSESVSDNLSLTTQGPFGGTTWSFVSDSETGLTILPNAFTLTENGQPQLVATLTYKNAAGGTIGTDQIFIQSDVEATPEPATASLLLLGGGFLAAAGRRRIRR